MNNKHLLWIALDLVFLIVFNIVFFMLGGTEHSSSVWVSYSFIHFAYIMLLITPWLVSKSTDILGFPLYSISSTYFIVVFVVGLIFIFKHTTNYTVAFLVQVVIAGIYAIILISNMLANKNTVESVEHHEMELQYVRNASSKLKYIMDSISDRKLYKKVEQLYDLLHSSPAKSSNLVRDYELTVLELVDVLKKNIDENDTDATENTIDKIEHNANERNRRLKYKSL